MAKLKFVAGGRKFRVSHWLGFCPTRWMRRAVDWHVARGGSWVFVVRPSRARPVGFWVHGMLRHFPSISTVEFDDGRIGVLSWNAL